MLARSRVLLLGPIAIALLALLSSLLKPPGVAAGTPTLMLSPTSGPSGTTVTASGSGFSANETVNLTWGTQYGTLLASPITDGLGAFSTTITIPPDSPGTYFVWAFGQSSGSYQTAPFTLTGSAPTATPTPTATPGSSTSPTATPLPASSPTPIATPTPTPSVRVSWTSLNTCFSVPASLYAVALNGHGTVIAVGQGGEIVRSTNEGSGWQQIHASSSASLDLWSVAFATTSTVWAGGQAGTLEVSTDGGTTWMPWPIRDSSGKAYYPNVHQIVFTSPSIGYLVGGEFTSVGSSTYEIGEIFRTTDGGITWNRLASVPAVAQWNSVAFNQNGVGLVVAASGDIARTTDGITWTQVPYTINRTLTHLNDVAFAADGTTAVAVGDNTVLLQSTDAGLSWQEVAAPATLSSLINFEGIAFTNSTLGSAVGGVFCTDCPGQTIASTGDAGADWSTTYANPSLSYLWRISCDTTVCIAVGDGGTLLASWATASTSPPPSNLTHHVFLPIVFRC